jgi:hypothetical protein
MSLGQFLLDIPSLYSHIKPRNSVSTPKGRAVQSFRQFILKLLHVNKHTTEEISLVAAICIQELKSGGW